jgi:hypothetical protein
LSGIVFSAGGCAPAGADNIAAAVNDSQIFRITISTPLFTRDN